MALTNLTFGILSAPTVQKFLSGSGTYNTPANCLYIHVRMVGGGGGGAGSGATPGTGGNGSASTFGTSLLSAGGGTGAVGTSQAGGAGGTASLGSGPIGTALPGGDGAGGQFNNGSTDSASGGQGGTSIFAAGASGGGNNNAPNAPANTGAGGGGGGNSGNSFYSGAGGGAGGYVDATIMSPSSSYAYTVGTGGNGATGSQHNGGNGGSGYIEVTEYYTFTGTASTATGGGSGAKNYLSSVTTSNGVNSLFGNFENAATSSFSLAHTSLSSFIPTSTATAGTAFSSSAGGSAASANLSFSAISSGQIGGLYSGSLVSSAASVAGDMFISNGWFIDNEDKAKVLTFKMYYTAASGAANLNFSGTSSNSFAVWIYDVTNGAWIMPAGVYGITQSSGVGYVTGTFQTTSNSTQYQFALININASAGAYSLTVDDIQVGPQTAPLGAAVSDWVAYTPTFSNLGTVSAVFAWSRRVGDSLEFQMHFQTGTGTASPASVTLGYAGGNGNVQIDTTKLQAAAVVGSGVSTASSTTQFAVYPLAGSGTPVNTLNLGVQSSTTSAESIANGNNTAFASGNFISLIGLVPIVGWSSNVQLSNDTDTRVVAASATVSTGTLSTSVGAPTQVTTFSGVQDTHGALNTGTGFYVVPVTGWYSASFSGLCASPTILVNLFIKKNGTTTFSQGITGYSSGNNNVGNTSGTAFFNAGDTIAFYASAASGTQSLSTSNISINRLSGPAVVAATESVNAKYKVSSTNAPGTNTPINFDSKIYDSHNAVTTGASWKFTAPTSGTYSVKVVSQVGTGSSASIILRKNGSNDTFIASASTAVVVSGSTDIRLNAGDFIDITSDSSFTFQSNTSISIARIGN